ncbi:MAG: hypothetical protein R3Y11_12585 [Pseudomonadota bacterium]
MDTTENYGFPLPSPSNTLEEDVYHLVDAFKGIDSELHEMGTNVDSVQEQMLAALAATAETEVRVAAMEERLLEITAEGLVL